MGRTLYFFAVAVFATLICGAENPALWDPVKLPAARQSDETGPAKNVTGFAWYRTWVKVPDGFFQPHERNLFEESVSLNIPRLAGAHEAFINGNKIGTGGEFPPNFRSGAAEFHRHKIPAGSLRKGEWNEIAIRVYNESGPAGFLGEAPFVIGYHDECVLEGFWEFRRGDEYRPGGALSEKPRVSAFETFQPAGRALGSSAQFFHGPKLPPAESSEKMLPAEDLAVDLLLHEPAVAQPVHFSFDERGRLWVAQYRQYPYPAGLTMLSRDRYYRSQFDKVPPPPPNHYRGADVISIHESSRGDGVFDRHKTFLDGLNMANAVVRGRGGVWIMHTPYLVFYPDSNFDDVPDGLPTVHLAGFGLEDTHSVANGLAWGMDGWLYGCQGSTTSSRVVRPAVDPNDAAGVYFEACMVWRYHPETRAYEIFAEGGGNNFGLEIDSEGRLYSGHNGGNTRGWIFVQGGFYLKQGADTGKYGPLRNAFQFGELPMMKSDSAVVRFSHFGAFVEGSAMPPKYAGLLFVIDPLHNLVIATRLRREGSHFATSDLGPVLSSADQSFRPVYIANAPDGSLLIADMYEHYIAHGQHYQSQLDPTSGRIYRLRSKDDPLLTDLNLAAKTTPELIALLSHSNKWHRQTAVRLLGERKDRQAPGSLRQLIDKGSGATALHALWALHQSSGLDERTALKAMKHPHPPVRAWTIRLLGDEWGVHPGLGAGVHALRTAGKSAGSLPKKLFAALLDQARAETDAEVCAQIASTARRLNPLQALSLVSEIMLKDEFTKDPFIPLLSWWVIEANIPSANEEVVSLFKSRALWDEPMVFEHLLPRLARRYAADDRRKHLLLCAELFRAAPASNHAAQLMKGFEEAFRGRAMTGLPDELVAAIATTGEAPLVVRVKQGEPAAVADALRLLKNPAASFEQRLLYARTFGEVRHYEAVPALLEVASSDAADALRKAALVSLASYDDDAIAEKALSFFSKLNSEVRPAALTLLTSRSKWTRKLLEAIASGRVDNAGVPAEIAERLRSHRDRSISEVALRLFPRTGASVGFQPRVDEISTILKVGTGNPHAGEKIYSERCAACHKLFFKGGSAGPDLTAYQRDNLYSMLVNIIDPNAEIREGYQHYNIEMLDDRSFSGFIVERDHEVLVLRGLDGENISLRLGEVKEIQATGRSLMPEGLLDDLSDQQLRDFFAFLRSSQPVNR